MKKILSIFALLLMAVTGAWADDTYTVQFKANGNTKTVENVVLPHQFQCSYIYENGELDQIIKELYGLSRGYCLGEIKSSGNENVTCGASGYDDYITISAPFEGTATVTGWYDLDDDDGNTLDYFLEISIPGYTEPAAAIFAIDTDGTTQDFGSVELDATAQKTFTVYNNGNATLNVSFAATGDFTVTDPASSRKFYLTDNFGWGTGYAYAWDSKGKALLGEWPGTACGNTTNDYDETMFVVTVPSNAAGVIVNNGNGEQTVDITNFTQGYWMDGTLDGSGHYTVEGYEGGSEETPAVLTVAAGESETFTVAMNTATLGSKSGNITLSFDAKYDTSFTIPCTGETVAPATKYDLTLADGSEAHGTVAFTVGGNAATQAEKDDVVTVSVTPNDGYLAEDVTVRAYTSWEAASEILTGGGDNPGLVSDIDVTKQQNSTWTFTMPEANVWVVVTYTKNLQDAWIQTIADQTYTGSAITPTVTVKDGATTLVLNTDYTVAYSNNVNTGTATVTVTGTGNYSGTATANFTIVADKSALNDDITEAEAYYNSIKDSNPAAAATLLETINAAKAVKDNADATQSEIETAAQTLTDALNAAKADVALKRITLTIPAKSYMARIDADKRQIETAVTGVKLYSVKSVTNTEVELTAELSVIAAEMPYFIYNDNDTEVEVSIIVSSEEADNVAYDSEHFKGTLVDKTFTDEDMEEADHYVLSGGSSFVWVKDAGVLSAGKCWIELIPTSAAHARRLSIVHEGELTPTGINAAKTDAGTEDAAVYDLQGRRVMQPTKGLFIVNGKKVVIK